MKYLLGAALCMALMIDANAAITTLNGTNVTWDVDFESAYFKGLTATVSGDTLRFTRVDGNAIVQSSATGLGAKESTEIRYSSKNGKLFDDFITVRTMNTLGLQGIEARTEGRDSYHLVSDSTRLGEITNSIRAAVNVWEPLMGGIPSASSSQRDSRTIKVKDNSSGGGDLPDGPLPHISVDKFLPKEARLYLYLEAESQIKYGGQHQGGDLSRASAQMDSFSLSALTAPAAPVPEPETYALLGMGLIGLIAARRRNNC